MARYQICQYVTVGAVCFIQLPDGPQCASSRVGFVTARNLAFNVCVHISRLAQILLKPRSVLAQVMPIPSQTCPLSAKMLRKFRCKCSHRPEMFIQRVRLAHRTVSRLN
ncbi:MAG: hypothetical protein BGO13_04780 [Burkholderiales bacterium 66-5]|nr:MAG: hypothetical protein BGO13_04780 [Burkholderiales bacterium 66-5]